MFSHVSVSNVLRGLVLLGIPTAAILVNVYIAG